MDRLRGIESVNTLAADGRANPSTTTSWFAKWWENRNDIFDHHKDLRAWSQWEIV